MSQVVDPRTACDNCVCFVCLVDLPNENVDVSGLLSMLNTSKGWRRLLTTPSRTLGTLWKL